MAEVNGFELCQGVLCEDSDYYLNSVVTVLCDNDIYLTFQTH